MKPEFFRRAHFIAGVFALLFAASAAAQEVEPTWVKEGVDWEQYNKFLVKPLNIDDVKVIRPPWAEDDPREWTIDIQDLEAIQAIFRDVMREVLSGNGGYKLVYAEGKDVLEVELELLSIMPWLRPGGDEDLDGFEVKTLGSGEITGRAELRDSTTRELLLLIEGDKAVGEKYAQFTLQNNISNIQSMFTAFATRLRNSMDRVHGK
ncbi:MAG: DUF3313 domain-containing protein [Gammaproteobacteria bacterium]|nr:DUF3313 domain-containing protein [Gammaproteobacteria bacterium]